jgi:regulator of protease activity HflC (stomatin/prohibitin superfamily)
MIATGGGKPSPTVEEHVKKFVFWAAILVVALIVFFGSWFTVDTGARGVVKTFGEAREVPAGEGLNFKIPLVQSVVKMSVQTQKYEADASAASHDLQVVHTKVAINYHIDPNTVTRIYREVGLAYEPIIIQPAVQEVVKATTAQFSAEELITRRAEVKEAISFALTQRLEANQLRVDAVSITDFDFSTTFNEAIEAKVRAEQLKLKADRDLERIQVEAAQKIASAQAEAESLRLQKQEVTAELIELRKVENEKLAIEKWNGVLPTVSGAQPFISVPLAK